MYHILRAIQRDGYQINKSSYTCLTCSFIRRQISQSTLKPKPLIATNVTVDKHLPISSVIRPPTVLEPVIENNRSDKEWTESRIDMKDLHQHYLKLSKSRLTSLVVVTTMAGYAMAPAPFDLVTFILCSAGTGMVSGAANSINQYHEVPFDAQMSRTKNRLLVRGILTPIHALTFAAVSGSLGLVTLYYGVNPVTAALGAANLFLYTSIYTPMKRLSILNTWIGSVVGAIPPLMGWAGCTGGVIDSGGLLLAGLLYAWQFPHFNALSWNLRPDYSRAGYRMMSVTNPGLCRRTALRYTIGVFGLCCAAPFCELTNIYFSIAVSPLNAYFVYLAWKFHQNSDSKTSRNLFRFSLIHLPALMILLLVNKHGLWSGNSKPKENSEVITVNKDEKIISSIFKKAEPL
ncbi:heme A:farnesyltransferase [Acyrthosiphon pisum]|uniref:Protoheme IX farnesyltransferase, mitochondrial n=2 Tax=Acyrthosiphon pisum TaxID=7029 RepID=C4WVL8_ACYPI|nr:heme A:farnesyltransferase [Acyrthosiphon pisum]BAH71938.1 ACYPI009141 [Acyrthosiphon pisum]|eukprot:NP_001153944.1 heme A:farnesyltransferase [Acyrthosiphon pisum]